MDEFKIVLVAVIFNRKTNKILIGKRENDKHFKELTWSFIGGRLNYLENPKTKIFQLIKDSIGKSILSCELISSMPHMNQKNIFVNYYYCELNDLEVGVKGNFVELKWVDKERLENYFTTTLQLEVKEFIDKL